LNFNDLTNIIIHKENNINHLYPLDVFMPNGISNTPFIHIYGDTEIGKTSLGLELTYRNYNNTFLYVDTYFQLYPNQLIDNTQLFKSNIQEEIYSYVELIEKNTLDYIILDSFSNTISLLELQSSTNYYINRRYEKLNNWLKSFIELCSSKNITVIVMNTINSNNKPYSFSTQLNKLCALDLKIENKVYNNDNTYTISLIANKNKFRNYYTKDSYEILLKGKEKEINNVM
jgi:archaellum biogenesis ATPase FlaH